jgi:hypothetical protein
MSRIIIPAASLALETSSMAPSIPITEVQPIVTPKVTKAPTDRTATIKLLVKENPKRGASRQRYNHYRDGMTVEQYVNLAGSKGMADIRWDIEHEFIALVK